MAAKSEHSYVEGIGRRKRAIARVRLVPDSKGVFAINDTGTLDKYFPNEELRKTCREALEAVGAAKRFSVSARVAGGGIRAQAEAIRLGIARALVAHEATLRGDLKKAGFLKRDPRTKERKKFGLKKARRAPQWSKR